MAELKVLVICGSLRKGSFNASVARALPALAPPELSLTPAASFGKFSIYDADDQTATGIPADVKAWCDAVRDADGVIIVSPEYNWSIPAGLKNAIDWASRPARRSVLTGKPVAIMGATPGSGGTARAQAHLRDGLAYTNGYVLPLPEVLVPLAAAKFDADGNLTDAETREAVRDLLVSLAAWTRRLRSTQESVAS